MWFLHLGNAIILLGSRYVGSITILTLPLPFARPSSLISCLPSGRSQKFLLCLLTQDLLDTGTFLRMWFSAGLRSKLPLASNGSCQERGSISSPDMHSHLKHTRCRWPLTLYAHQGIISRHTVCHLFVQTYGKNIPVSTYRDVKRIHVLMKSTYFTNQSQITGLG